MMELMYAITINEEPVPQARARATILTTKSGKQWVNFYTPVKSANFKKMLQSYMTESRLPEILLDEPLIMEAKFYKTKPKSAKRVWLTTKPDLDNYIKAVKDAMSGLVYRDDSIIVGYKDCWKLYGAPRIEIKLFRVGA
jgi:Holliday junction resolvase RusA-like endonuclease